MTADLNDLNLIYGYLLAHGEIPQPVQDAIDRLMGAEPAEEEEPEFEEEQPEPEPAPKAKRANNMSPENRAKAAHRMREMQRKKKAEAAGEEFVPEPFVWPPQDAPGNVEAPSEESGQEQSEPLSRAERMMQRLPPSLRSAE